MKKIFITSIFFILITSIFCIPVLAEESKSSEEINRIFDQAIKRYEEKIDQNQSTEIKYGIIKNKDGSICYKLKIFPAEDSQNINFSKNQINAQTYVFKIDNNYLEKEEEISTFGQDYGENWVAQSGIKGYMTVYYNGVKNYGTITQVTGGWDIYDGSMQVTNKHIIARTGNSRVDWYPNSLYFNYSTGFSEISNSQVTSIADIVRGGDVWSCVFYV